MSKLNLPPVHIAARRGPDAPAFREVCVPLYAPAPAEHRLYAVHAFDAMDQDVVVDASGITINDDDDDDCC